MKNSKRKKTKITKTNDSVYIIDFFKKNKGFTIALILSIIITIFFLFSLTLQTTSSEDIAYAKAINEELNSYLDFMISEVENDLLTNVEEPLDKYYFESIKNDFEWLKEKNNELFSSKENILMKMAGFGTFFDRILYLNEEFSFEITEPDYETTINYAKNKNYSFLELVNETDLVELKENEKKVFNETIDYLGKNYFNWKKELLNNDRIEKRYVEAKKIIFLFE